MSKLKASSVHLLSALHYQSFPNDSFGNHKPQILHNSHALFLPCKMDTADFHIRFPSLEMKQHKKGKVRFLSNSHSMSGQGKSYGGTRVEQLPKCSSEHCSGQGGAPRSRKPLDKNKPLGPFLILILRSKDFLFLWAFFQLCTAARPLGPSPVLCCWLPSQWTPPCILL